MIRGDTDAMIGFLNEIAHIDPEFMRLLIGARVQCNAALADHPSVQVAAPGVKLDQKTSAPNHPVCGVLGLLNGYCGTIDEGKFKGWGPITAIIEEDGRVTGFRRTEAAKRPQAGRHRAPVDVMDDVLRPLLGSMEATSAALSCWHALRRAGWLQDEPDEPLENNDDRVEPDAGAAL